METNNIILFANCMLFGTLAIALVLSFISYFIDKIIDKAEDMEDYGKGIKMSRIKMNIIKAASWFFILSFMSLIAIYILHLTIQHY